VYIGWLPQTSCLLLKLYKYCIGNSLFGGMYSCEMGMLILGRQERWDHIVGLLENVYLSLMQRSGVEL